ncbi:MAG: hypothetical protein OXT67_06600, partial [Zetaproteobacteria bacterium]|nr:hypothetical protein [Zetaproteobacteria bacterium]
AHSDQGQAMNSHEYIPQQTETELPLPNQHFESALDTSTLHSSSTETGLLADRFKRMILLIAILSTGGMLGLIVLESNFGEELFFNEEFASPQSTPQIFENQEKGHVLNQLAEILPSKVLEPFDLAPRQTPKQTNQDSADLTEPTAQLTTPEELIEAVDLSIQENKLSPAEAASSIWSKVPKIEAYQQIENPLPPSQGETELSWSANQEQNWRTRISHIYPYQRFATVQEVITAQYTESTVILWEALEDEGFWIRMYALMGLAEFGIKTSMQDLQTALKGVSKGRVYRFIKRFEVDSTSGQRHILRKLIGYVSPRMRISILNAIALGEEDIAINKNFLEAAVRHDPSTNVRRRAKQLLSRAHLHSNPGENSQE